MFFFLPQTKYFLWLKTTIRYHADEIKTDEVVAELRDLRTVRQQCQRIYELGEKDKLNFWRLNLKNFDHCVSVVKECVDRNYRQHNIPLHSRFRHFDENSLNMLLKKWDDSYVEKKEQVRRLIDLTMISVLLDAGAGAQWRYVDETGETHSRSEGLAIASFNMFVDGVFSSDAALKTRVNSLGLLNLTEKKLRVGFQVSTNNEMIGLKGRTHLLQRLGKALEKHKEYFGTEVYRPGHILDYCLRHREPADSSEDNVKNSAQKSNKVSIRVLWKSISEGLE